MTNYVEKIVDAITNEEIIRPFTVEEIAEIEANQAAVKAEILAIEAEAKAKAKSKADLLAKLGITEDEAKLLLS